MSPKDNAHDHQHMDHSKMDHDRNEHLDHFDHKAHAGHEHNHGAAPKNPKWFIIRSTVLIMLFAYFAIVTIVKPSGDIEWTLHWGFWLPLTTYVVAVEGFQYFGIYKRMLKGLLGMDTLIGLGAHILYIYSIFMVAFSGGDDPYDIEVMWEGTGILILITNVGHYLEDHLKSSTISAYKKLEDMKNAEVLLYKDGETTPTNVKNISVGDIIVVKRGGFVGLDGIVQSSSHFNYQSITGESDPIELNEGDKVLSGSNNLGESVMIKVTSTSEHSTINHIINKIEEVSMSRPKMQQLADRILRFFTPTVMLIALSTFAIWMILGYTVEIDLPWVDHNEYAYQDAIYAGVTVIAVACPCALGIATPLVYAVSSMLSAEDGIVINEPRALEEINEIKFMAFDKTGTITSNEMEVANVQGDIKLLDIALALENETDHPIASTIVKYIESKGIKPAAVKDVKHMDNVGIVGKYRKWTVTMKRYGEKSFGVSPETTNVALYANNSAVLVFELKNKVNEGVRELIEQLKARKIIPVMITGDNDDVAKHIASEVGIDRVFSNVTPQEKADIIGKLQEEGKVAFVGDGFNDAVAIKKANVSIAFNTGSDVTNALSDVSMMRNDFHTIIEFIQISKMNNARTKLALTYAFMFNSITIPIATILLIQPWVGAAIMATSDILVALNAWLYRRAGKRKVVKYESKQTAKAS